MGRRGQDIHLLSLEGTNMATTSCQFQMLENTKTSKPGTKGKHPTIKVTPYSFNSTAEEGSRTKNELFVSALGFKLLAFTVKISNKPAISFALI